ncbi:hypothetical protein [Nonomuraea gerenzanensis]|uniref:Uncharacterized protein n=1 Tax=Nonomuraea gerenzanensis TaxID=93944 RepID=A0A1M4ECZ2_9ACTN|nr:hypothetical protein [Nonomuraea gerenzanensis]UBU08407.1 hypothetical protein LCN96_28855 [Nonomuraea gerenzanensis]SBO96749.1 hypothetical protein BN4615_P6265 [Nonomuraea gerenzanensis]
MHRAPAQQGYGLPYAALTVIYGLALLFTWFAEISEMSNETSGFTDFRPWWRTAGVVNLLVLAGLAQVMSVVHVMRARSPQLIVFSDLPVKL